MDDSRLARIDQLIGNFFPPLLRKSLTLLIRYKVVEPDWKLGPFLRDALMKANNDWEALEDWMHIQVPVAEAASLLAALESVHARMRVSVAGSHPDLDRVLAGRNLLAIAEAAFGELARTE